MFKNLKPIKYMSILFKVSISYLLIILFIVFFSYYNQYYALVKNIEDSHKNTIINTISNISHDLEKKQDEMYSKLNALTYNVIIKKYLELYEVDPVNYYTLLISFLGSYLSEFNTRNQDIYSIGIIKYNKTVPKYPNIIFDMDQVKDELWLSAVDNLKLFDTVLVGPHPYRNYDIVSQPSNTDLSVISAYEKIFTTNLNNSLGIVEVNMLIDDFFDIISHNRKNNMQVIIKDSSDNIVISNINNVTEIMQQIDMPKNNETETIFLNSTINQEKYIVAVKSNITDLNLKIIIVYPFSLIRPSIKERFLPLIYTFLLITASVIFISFFISNLIFRRLNKLLLSMKQVEEGNFNVQIEVDYMDEVGHIKIAFNRMTNEINNLINRVYKTQLAANEATLSYLITQMKPHFLFNSLEGIRMMAKISGNKEISDALYSLSNIYRSLINPKKFNTLKIELDFLDSYIYIQNIHNNDRIKYIVKIERELMNVEIPTLILQPLVENAINHGFYRKLSDFTIIISVTTTDNNLLIKVTDSGKGISPERLEVISNSLAKRMPLDSENISSSGIALYNINERIKLYYGENYGIFIKSEKDKFTEVSIDLPSRHVTK